MPYKTLLRACLISTTFLVWFDPAPARAGLEECGDIDLNQDVECQVQVEGGCDVVCDPSKLELACSGELYASCRSDGCDVDVDVACEASCNVDCAAECELDPGNFSCEGRCDAECDADCEAQCEASGNKAECAASCQATCSGECSASCEGKPPELNCEAKCAASCQGECRAEANIDCQIDCQADGYLECKSNMAEICDAQCKRPEGVVTCDGQFVNAEDLNQCVSAIEAAINIEVEVTGRADGECSGNQCTGEAEGSVSCAVGPHQGTAPTSLPGWAALAVVGAVGVARRRRPRG